MTNEIINKIQYENNNNTYILNDSRLDKYTRLSIDSCNSTTLYASFVPLAYLQLKEQVSNTNMAQFCGTFLLEQFIDYNESSIENPNTSNNVKESGADNIFHASCLITVDVTYSSFILTNPLYVNINYVSNPYNENKLLNLPTFCVCGNKSVHEANLNFYINNTYNKSTFCLKPLNIFSGDSSICYNTYNEFNDVGYNTNTVSSSIIREPNYQDLQVQMNFTYIQTHISSYAETISKDYILQQYDTVSFLKLTN